MLTQKVLREINEKVRYEPFITPPTTTATVNVTHIAAVDRKTVPNKGKKEDLGKAQMRLWDPVVVPAGGDNYEIVASEDFLELSESFKPQMEMLKSAGIDAKLITVETEHYEEFKKHLQGEIDAIKQAITEWEMENSKKLSSMDRMQAISQIMMDSSALRM